MRNTLTVRDVPSPSYWTVRIPKPRLPLLSKATIRWTAALALSLGFNVGFLSEAFADPLLPTPAEQAACEASAELHYAISGGQDAAWEDAMLACEHGLRYTDVTSAEYGELRTLIQAHNLWDRNGNPVGAL